MSRRRRRGYSASTVLGAVLLLVLAGAVLVSTTGGPAFVVTLRALITDAAYAVLHVVNEGLARAG